MNIIQDTLSDAILLSVFDFVACFFVLYFISFFIRALGFLSRILLKKQVRQSSGKDLSGCGARGKTTHLPHHPLYEAE